MRQTKTITTQKTIDDTIQCDKCGKVYPIINGGCKEVSTVAYNLTGDQVVLDLCGKCIEKIKVAKS
jgi:hypothetical protein